MALGFLLFSHAGAQTAACIRSSSVYQQQPTYRKSWDWVNLVPQKQSQKNKNRTTTVCSKTSLWQRFIIHRNPWARDQTTSFWYTVWRHLSYSLYVVAQWLEESTSVTPLGHPPVAYQPLWEGAGFNPTLMSQALLTSRWDIAYFCWLHHSQVYRNMCGRISTSRWQT